MALRIKLDEDLAPSAATPLVAEGHEVFTVVAQGWSGLKDPEIWPLIRNAGEFFVTADKGFGDIRAYPPGTHPGILVLRPDRESIAAFRAMLSRVLAAAPLETLTGCTAVVTPRGVRVRRPPAASESMP